MVMEAVMEARTSMEVVKTSADNPTATKDSAEIKEVLVPVAQVK
jgi:hypothetical protein